MNKNSLFVLYPLVLLVLLLAACATFDATDVPLTHLASYQVVDPEGNTVAQVEDVLIAADDGQISYALVILRRDPFSYGKAAFMDAAVPRTAVPWEYFTLNSASEQLQLNVDSSLLYAAPLLKEKPNQLEADWDADIRAYWRAYSISSKQE